MAQRYVPVYHPSRPGETARTEQSGGREREETTSSSLDSPVISVQSKQIVCSCGSPTTLMCSVRGSPTPIVEWVREGKGICEAGPKYQTLCEPPLFYLIVNDTHTEDSGDYRIVAKNERGESSQDICVLVLTPEAPKSEFCYDCLVGVYISTIIIRYWSRMRDLISGPMKVLSVAQQIDQSREIAG